MWLDERGSEVLSLPECRELLAIGSASRLHGHLGIPTSGAPVVLPMDYGTAGPDLVLQTGVSIYQQLVGRAVAFQVDGTIEHPSRPGAVLGHWSVLVRGPAFELHGLASSTRLPEPKVDEAGSFLVRIRADVVTGRRTGLRAALRRAS